jgi:hypothetical protein
MLKVGPGQPRMLPPPRPVRIGASHGPGCRPRQLFALSHFLAPCLRCCARPPKTLPAPTPLSCPGHRSVGRRDGWIQAARSGEKRQRQRRRRGHERAGAHRRLLAQLPLLRLCATAGASGGAEGERGEGRGAALPRCRCCRPCCFRGCCTIGGGTCLFPLITRPSAKVSLTHAPALCILAIRTRKWLRPQTTSPGFGIVTSETHLQSPAFDPPVPPHTHAHLAPQEFADFYLSKHGGRKLTWHGASGTCLVRAHFPRGTKELQASLHQVRRQCWGVVGVSVCVCGFVWVGGQAAAPSVCSSGSGRGWGG